MSAVELGLAALPKDLAANPVLARWVRVGADGVIDVRVGKVELGQGILTALAQLAADELDADLAQLRMMAANTTAGPDEGLTSGSMSISDCGPALQLVTAAVRDLFVREAARQWQVDHALVTVTAGDLVGPGGERTSYAALSGLVDLEVPIGPGATTKTARRLAGTSAARLDLPDKVTGRPRFIHDLRLPGQLFGRVVRPPSPGAVLAGLDAAAAETRVRRRFAVEVVRDGSFLAVVGAGEAAVARAVETLRGLATWDERDTLPDEDDLGAFLRAGPHETIPIVEDDPALRPVGRLLRATYSRPFVAHASMAPSCALAWWHEDGRLAVWSHSQGIHNLRDAIAASLGLDPLTVTVEHAEGAGCYGHNGADDAAFDAVLLARAVPGRPVHVMWSRQDELAWSPFGSAMTADVEATLDDAGRLTSWSYDVFSQGHTARPGYAGVAGLLAATTLSRPAMYPGATDPPAARGGGTTRNALPIYDVPHRRVVGHRLVSSPIRSSALRSLGAHLNVFAIESFVDEAAALVGQDPLEYRLAHLGDPRARRVLEVAAAAGGWGDPCPDGVGRGVGFARYKGRGAYCAVVALVEAEQEVRVRRLTIAVDVGQVVNPDGVLNQIEGGATQATSWTLTERVRFDRRRITSVDWESYPILRFTQAPPVHVEIVASPGEPSVGAGEAAQGPTSAAIANAVAAGLGVRVRDLPITADAVIAAIESQH